MVNRAVRDAREREEETESENGVMIFELNFSRSDSLD